MSSRTDKTTVAPAPDYALQIACAQAPIEEEPFARWRAQGGQVAAEFYRDADNFTIRFLGRADFVVARDLATVTAWPLPGTSERNVCDLYLNQVLPLIQGQQGALIIHASAVAAPSGALGFVAPTGRGKSTLAAAFARAGTPFLSDDGLALLRGPSGFIAQPNRPSFRLWQDSEAALGAGTSEPSHEKLLVKASPSRPFHGSAMPLRALYFLGTGEAASPVIAPLRPQRAIAELMNHSFLLDVADAARLRRQFDQVGELGESVPCYTLDYPREYSVLPEVIAAVLEHAANQVDNR